VTINKTPFNFNDAVLVSFHKDPSTLNSTSYVYEYEYEY